MVTCLVYLFTRLLVYLLMAEHFGRHLFPFAARRAVFHLRFVPIIWPAVEDAADEAYFDAVAALLQRDLRILVRVALIVVAGIVDEQRAVES